MEQFGKLLIWVIPGYAKTRDAYEITTKLADGSIVKNYIPIDKVMGGRKKCVFKSIRIS